MYNGKLVALRKIDNAELKRFCDMVGLVVLDAVDEHPERPETGDFTVLAERHDDGAPVGCIRVDEFSAEKSRCSMNYYLCKEYEYDEAKQREWEAYMATYVPPTTAPPAGTTNNSTGTNTGTTVKPSGGGGSWLVPCSYTSITSPFGYRESPTAGASTYHQGVDLDTGTGWPVVAARAGTAYTAYGNAAGNYVTIDHHDGFRSIYMHLNGFAPGINGKNVSAGELIGYTGSTGVSTGDHLHFGISLNGVYVNPCNYVPL